MNRSSQGYSFLAFYITLCSICLLSSTYQGLQKDPEFATKNQKKCDLALMKSFKLEGMMYPHKPLNLSICPAVEENCCTVVDELVILKFWNEFSLDKWKKFSAYMIYLIGNIINFQPYVQKMGMQNVPFFFTKKGDFTYHSYTCSLIENSKNTLKFHLVKKKFGERLLKLKKRMLLDVFDGDRKKLKNYMKQEKKVTKSHFSKNRRNKKLAPIMIDGMSEDERKSFLTKLTKPEKTAFLNQNSIHIKAKEAKTRSRYLFLRDIKIMTKSMERKLNKLSQNLQNKVAESLDQYEHFLDKSKVNFKPVLEKYQHSVDQFMESGKFYIEQLPEFVKFNFQSLETFMMHIKAHMLSNLESAYQAMEVTKDYTSTPNFMLGLLAKIKQSHFPEILIPRIPDLTLPSLKIEPLQLSKIQCTDRMVPQSRNLLVINTPKFEYCSNALTHVMKIKMNDYKTYLNSIKDELLRLIGVKRGLYCVLCDVNYQTFIDKKHNMILIDRGFCQNYIADFKVYFEFMNITFIKYLDAIFQYISCAESPGDELAFPFFTIMEKKKRMMSIWKRCFDSLGGPFVFKNCYFICKEFRYDKNSPVLEGDVDFLKTVYFELMSFMRKNKLHMIKTLGRSDRKIEWFLQDSPLVQGYKSFNPKKHMDKISNWTPGKAFKKFKKSPYYDPAIHSKKERILEVDENYNNQNEKHVKVNLSETDSDLENLEKLLNNDDEHNIYQNTDIFFKPTKITLLKTSTVKNNEANADEFLSHQRVLEQEDRQLNMHTPLIQGFDPYIDVVRKDVDLDRMKEEFHQEQVAKELEKEKTKPIEREVKTEEIYERIEPTVDLSTMDQVFLREGDGIPVMKISRLTEFDLDQKELMKENLKSLKLEVIHGNVITPVVKLSNKNIDNFNKDINMNIKNNKNEMHKFKKVQDVDKVKENDRDFYQIEAGEQQDKLNGTAIKKEKDDGTFAPYENLKLDLSKPQMGDEKDEIDQQVEENERIKSVWDTVQHFRN